MPSEPQTIAFVPVAGRDLPLLQRWMNQPHWRRWWGEPEAELGLIRDMIEGRDSTRPFIFHVGGEPTGYIQYWMAGEEDGEPWLKELPEDAVGVDLSIGEKDRLSKGIGSGVLRAFAERLAQAGHGTIIIDPDIDNRRAVRAYEKAGFKTVPNLRGRTGDALIMQFTSNEQ